MFAIPLSATRETMREENRLEAGGRKRRLSRVGRQTDTTRLWAVGEKLLVGLYFCWGVKKKLYKRKVKISNT